VEEALRGDGKEVWDLTIAPKLILSSIEVFSWELPLVAADLRSVGEPVDALADIEATLVPCMEVRQI